MYLLFLVQKIDLVWDLKSYFSDKYDIWYYNNDLFYLKKATFCLGQRSQYLEDHREAFAGLQAATR